MRLYAYVTHDTGDGMPPFIFVRRTLEEIKAAAVAAVQFDPADHYDMDEEITHDDRWLERAMDEAVRQIKEWDGQEELSVDYWDGNMGNLTLTTTELPE